MKGCRPRQGGEFKEVFLLLLLVLLFDQRQNTRDEPVVFGALMSLSKQLEPLCPMLVFCKLQQGDQWTDPDNVSDKHAVELMNTDRPGLMDVFCGH